MQQCVFLSLSAKVGKNKIVHKQPNKSPKRLTKAYFEEARRAS